MFSMTSKPSRASNPNCARTFASLRLYGDDLVPDDVSRLMNLQPTDAAPKGFRTPAPRGKVRLAPTGRWILSTEDQICSTVVEDHLEWLLDRLDAAGVKPLDLPGVSHADIFCYWLSATGHGGPVVSPDVLGRLAGYRLLLGFDIYFGGEPREIDAPRGQEVRQVPI
jgi:hypothetical protein